MTKQLRTRFICVSMLAVFVILTLFIGAVNVANYVSYKSQCDQLIRYIYETGGNPDIGRRAEAQREPFSQTGQQPFEKENAPRTGEFRLFGGLQINDEARFRLRFFMVELNDDRTVRSINVDQIFMVDEKEASDYAERVIRSGKTSGTVDSYVYRLFDAADGGSLVFLDRAMERSNLRSLLLQSSAIALIGLALLFIVVRLVSPLAIAPFVENMRQQKRFITDAGHEIKTPIAIISANADALAVTSGDNEFLRNIKHQTTRLSGLVGDLVTLSRLDENDRKQERTTFDLSEVVKSSAEDFTILAESKSRQLTYDVQAGIVIEGDHASIERLVGILLDNAVKYAPENSTVTVLLTASSKTAQLSVSNISKDLSAGDVSHVFDRFWRADSSRDRKTGGYGIGLSLAKAIALNHGGEISAKLRGEVVTFSVSLPLR